MKRLLLMCAVLLCVLAGCGKTVQEPPTAPPGKAEATLEVVVYAPDADASVLAETAVTVPVHEAAQCAASSGADVRAGGIIAALVQLEALPADVRIAHFALENGALILDLTEDYLTALRESGSAGEEMLLYAVVDSFFAAYRPESLTLTAGGEPIETGHSLYDRPFTRMLYLPEDAA